MCCVITKESKSYNSDGFDTGHFSLSRNSPRTESVAPEILEENPRILK